MNRLSLVCWDCGHRWVEEHQMVRLVLMARFMRELRCPQCEAASNRIGVAQDTPLEDRWDNE